MPWWGWLVLAAPVLMIVVIFVGGFVLWMDTYATRGEGDPRDVMR